MPAWLIQLIITLAVKFGLPWILKKFPGIPPEVMKVIEELLGNLATHKEEKAKLVAEAKEKVAACYGPECKLR